MEFPVGGMTCNGCVRKLETALRGIDLGRTMRSYTRTRPRTTAYQPTLVVLPAITSTGFSVLSQVLYVPVTEQLLSTECHLSGATTVAMLSTER